MQRKITTFYTKFISNSTDFLPNRIGTTASHSPHRNQNSRPEDAFHALPQYRQSKCMKQPAFLCRSQGFVLLWMGTTSNAPKCSTAGQQACRYPNLGAKKQKGLYKKSLTPKLTIHKSQKFQQKFRLPPCFLLEFIFAILRITCFCTALLDTLSRQGYCSPLLDDPESKDYTL